MTAGSWSPISASRSLGCEATNELLTVVIVDLENGSAGLFASSVPGNTPQYNEPAKQAMEGLQVS